MSSELHRARGFCGDLFGPFSRGFFLERDPIIRLEERSEVDRESEVSGSEVLKAHDSSAPAVREQDAIYQKGRLVARAAEVDVDLEAKEIRFGEIYNSDYLLIPEECEFQKYRIIIQRIAYATKVDRGAEHKGRVLRGSVADILGYRQQ
jgi:hypothetical protein